MTPVGGPPNGVPAGGDSAGAGAAGGGSAGGGAAGTGAAGGGAPDDREPEERDPGLARARTALAWTRTAIAFAALGGAVLKVNVVSGLIILAIAPLVWQLGRVLGRGSPGDSPPVVGTTRVRLVTVSIVAVALLSLIVALLDHSAPGALH